MNRTSALLVAMVGCSSAEHVPAGSDGDDAGGPAASDASVGTDAGGALVEDCASYPFKAETLYAERVGFGRKATGGQWSMPYHVTTLANDGPGSLRVALESPQPYWIVFDVAGVIDLDDDDGVRVKSNKTIDGRGRDITIDGNLKIDAGTKNLVFTDVTFQFPAGWATQSGDMISIRGHGSDDPEAYDTRDLWFHHLDLGRGGDGQLDNRGGTYITISWSHMHSHAKAFLHANDTDQNPSRGNRTTYHHNFFDRVTRRGPQFHWGLADFFNNYQYQWYEFGAAAQREAQFLSEHNIYEARPGSFCLSCPDPNNPNGDSDLTVSKIALTPSWDAPTGFIKSVGDVALEGAVITEHMPLVVFDRAAHYPAVVDPADETLKQALMTKTGPRRDYCAQ